MTLQYDVGSLEVINILTLYEDHPMRECHNSVGCICVMHLLHTRTNTRIMPATLFIPLCHEPMCFNDGRPVGNCKSAPLPARLDIWKKKKKRQYNCIIVTRTEGEECSLGMYFVGNNKIIREGLPACRLGVPNKIIGERLHAI